MPETTQVEEQRHDDASPARLSTIRDSLGRAASYGKRAYEGLRPEYQQLVTEKQEQVAHDCEQEGN